MTTTAINSATTTGSSNSTSNSSLNSLSSADFMKLMITQLEHQDPMNPTDSNQMLSQLSEISNLQSNTQMQSSLQSLTLQQSIGAGGNLIGKSVTGLLANGTQVTGNVTSVQVQNNSVYLGLDDGSSLAMANVTNISIPLTASTTNANAANGLSNTTTSSSALQTLLSSLGAG